MISKNCPSLCIITFTTNGLEPKIILSIAQLIKTVLPDADFFITISLDGDEKLHNKLRGIENNYKNAQETYSLLRDNNFSVHWGATLNNSNAEYFSKNSASQIKAVSLVHDQGIYNTKFKIENEIISRALKNIIKNYRIANISEIIEFIFLKLGLKYLHNNRQKLPIPCSVLSTSLHISPYGDVSPCMYMPSIGNIKTSKIDTVLDSTLAKHMLEDIKNANCPKCWMNCYAPHSMMSAPLKTMKAALWK
jgi:sulfatase maturation enzyme AslB (radical SAM superfamily)